MIWGYAVVGFFQGKCIDELIRAHTPASEYPCCVSAAFIFYPCSSLLMKFHQHTSLHLEGCWYIINRGLLHIT